ncbi:MAG: response regulator transcription factor [Candidatus Eremiobacterota bacterium]
MNPIRTLLVDDHLVLREALASALEDFPEIQVVGAAGSGDGLSLVDSSRPHVVVVALCVPHRAGVFLLRCLRQRHPSLPVVVLATHHERRSVMRALGPGPCGYVPRSATLAEFRQAIRTVAAGHRHVPPDACLPARPDDDLTDRERDILSLAVQGKNTLDIARHLNLKRSTVKTHLSSLYLKLGVSDRTQAVLYALQRNLVPERTTRRPR